MKKLEVTNEQVSNFRMVATDIINRKKGKQTRFTYALQRNIDLTEKAAKKLLIEVQNIEVEHASVDSEGNLLLGLNGGLKFTPAKDREASQKKLALLEHKAEVEQNFEFDINKNGIPEGVTISNWKYLHPFVLPELNDELLDKLLDPEHSQKV